jgi:hypothetical protein
LSTLKLEFWHEILGVGSEDLNLLFQTTGDLIVNEILDFESPTLWREKNPRSYLMQRDMLELGITVKSSLCLKHWGIQIMLYFHKSNVNGWLLWDVKWVPSTEVALHKVGWNSTMFKIQISLQESLQILRTVVGFI